MQEDRSEMTNQSKEISESDLETPNQAIVDEKLSHWLEKWEKDHHYSLLNLRDAERAVSSCFDYDWLKKFGLDTQAQYLEAIGRLYLGLSLLSGAYTDKWRDNFTREAERLFSKLSGQDKEEVVRNYLQLGGIFIQFSRDTNISGKEKSDCAKGITQLKKKLKEDGQNQLIEVLDNPYHLNEGDQLLRFDEKLTVIQKLTIEIIDFKEGDAQIMIGGQSYSLSKFNEQLAFKKWMLPSGDNAFGGSDKIRSFLEPWQPGTKFHSEVRLPLQDEPLIIDGTVISTNIDQLSELYAGLGMIEFIFNFPNNQKLMTVDFEANGKIHRNVDVRMLLPVLRWQKAH